MKNIKILIISLLSITISCNDDESPKLEQLVKETLSGFVQKGPFINGTSITVAELDESLVQSGNTFSTQIIDNSGSFEFKNLTLNSPFVQLQAAGFYFDEVSGEKSSAQLTLFALSDISSIDQINVNILTHLEKGRIEFLVGNDIEFNHAKDSAQHELLSAFGIDNQNIENSEELDISINNTSNATLIAISIILQSNNSVADLTELLANINTDFRQDGIINSQSIKSKLFNTTQNLNLEDIRTNLENRYTELGLDADISNFESIIEQYLASQTPFDIDTKISNVTCKGLNNGSIDITINEGTEPFTYQWSNGAITEDINNLSPGSYSVTIVDANDYVLNKENMLVSEPEELVATFSVNHVTSISGNDGSITLSISGGIEPYTFEWSNSETSDNLQNLEKGFYSVIVQDSNSCNTQIEITIQEPIELSFEKTDVNCFGENQGTIDLSITGGLEPYSVQWNNGSQSTELANLTPSTYSVTVTDELGYSVIESIVIDQPDEITFEYVRNFPTPGENDGSLILSISGGTSPYQYEWSTGSSSENSGQIGAGTYDVTISDVNSCTITISIEQYSAIVDDRDNQEYKVVKIADQIWFAENLRATKFNDGSNIPNITDGTSWLSTTTPAYCWYMNDPDNKEVYGALYNGFLVIEVNGGNKNVCPIGWRIPNDNDWSILINNFGGESSAGGHLKESGTTHWTSPNSGATNSSGFTAVPAGYRYTDFSDLGTRNYLWSNQIIDEYSVNALDLKSAYSSARLWADFKMTGKSIRCLKD